MLTVKFSKAQAKIALIHAGSGGESSSVTFPYQQAQAIAQKIRTDKGVFLGKVSTALNAVELPDILDKITRAYSEIKDFLGASLDVDPSFSEPLQQWEIKVFNSFGKTKYLVPEMLDEFLASVQQTRVVQFDDQTVVRLNDDQLESLMEKLNVVMEQVIGDSQGQGDEDWSHQTIVVDF
jgi:hypothetical protein